MVVSQADPAITFTARAPLDQALSSGERVHLSCRPEDIILLEE
jgi:hypothetical protein